MAKIDRVKEFINYLKVLLVLMLATTISLIGWLVNNYQNAEVVFVYLSVASIFTLLFISILVNKKIIRDIKSLEDLE
jgi:ATP/ADP translocase